MKQLICSVLCLFLFSCCDSLDGPGGEVTEFPTTVTFSAEGGTQTLVSRNRVSNWWFNMLWFEDRSVYVIGIDTMISKYPSLTWLKGLKSSLKDQSKPYSVYKVEGEWFSFEKINDYTIRIDMTPTDTLRTFKFNVFLGDAAQIITVVQQK